MITDAQMLNHIYQSTQMGRESILSVLRHTEQYDFCQALQQQMSEYNQINDQARKIMLNKGIEPESLNSLVKFNAQLVGSIKAGVNDSTSHIAEMMIQGNTKGVNECIKQLREYGNGDERVHDLAKKLLATERNNIEQMKGFLS